MKICLSLSGESGNPLYNVLKKNYNSYDIIEIRDDCYSFKENEIILLIDDIKKISPDREIMLTIKNAVNFNNALKLVKLIDYIDIDYKILPCCEWNNMASSIRECGVEIIVSYHQFESTPGDVRIKYIISQLENLDCDIIKLAFMAQNEGDCIRLMDMKKYIADKRYILISMGEKGIASRIKAHELGSEIVYGYGNKPTAQGQLSVGDLKTIYEKVIGYV